MYKAERIGTHIILDMVGIDFILLDEMDGFVKWMDGTLWDYECDVLGVQKHKFKPQGFTACLLYTSPSPRDRTRSRMPSSA